MTSSARPGVTELLRAWRKNDPGVADELIPLVYAELRRAAARYLRRERRDHTLQPTALVHEAYLRLAAQNVEWKNREQFFGTAAQAMRRILVDHARRHQAGKREGQLRKVSLDEALTLPLPPQLDLMGLDEALIEFSRMDPAAARVVELRFFGGLSVNETAEVLGVSATTVKREWTVAKAWLHTRMRHA